MLITFDPIFVNCCKKLENVSYLKYPGELEKIHFDDCEGIIVRLGVTLDERLLKKFARLKFIGTITTGLDHIDLEYCDKNNIEVISLKGEFEFLSEIRATPEHTWGLLLSLIRSLPQAILSVKDNCWDSSPFWGEELFNKTIGIIGFGRIGKILSKYANAFEMNVLAYDKSNFDDIKFGVKKVGLDYLLENSHIISVNLTLNEDTKNFIGREQFQKMKLIPWFINTARGAIVDEEALLEALEKRWIKGAALDVLSNETAFKDSKAINKLIGYMKNNKNLLITPHIAGSTRESMERTALFIQDKILAL